MISKYKDIIISFCCMLHNFIRTKMPIDDIEVEINNEPTPNIDYNLEVIDTVEPSNKWTIWRQDLA